QRFGLDEAKAIGLVTLADATGSGWSARKESWWSPQLSAHDQGNLGDCVGFTGSRSREVLRLQGGHPYLHLSELWPYREWERKFEPDQIGVDTGGYGAWYEAILIGRGHAFAD